VKSNKNSQLQKIKGLLKQLKLPTMAAQLEEIDRGFDQQQASYYDFLEVLAEREVESRWNKRIGRYLKDSALPSTKTFDTFELNRLSQVIRRKIRDLRSGEFLNKRENVLAFGLPGRGKTHLLCALCNDLVQQGHRLKYVTAVDFVQQLLRAKNELSLQRLFKRLDRIEGIFIDDFGYVQYSREEMDVLFAFLAHRYERKSVILTSNLAFKDWGKIFKDEMTAAAAIDRLVHHSHILHLRGQSYRSKPSSSRRKSQTPTDDN